MATSSVLASTIDGNGESTADRCYLQQGADARAWPQWRKMICVLVTSYCEFLVFLVSMMLAPSVPSVLETFRPDGSDKHLGSFCVTVYILGFCVGPLLLGPLSDLYGRIIICRTSIVFYLGFTIACAFSPNLEALIAFRFSSGCFGGALMAMGSAVIADLYDTGHRGTPLAIYSAGAVLAPALGPILGGIITGGLGWRWVFRIAAILSGIAAAGVWILLPETQYLTLTRKREGKVNLREDQSRCPREHAEVEASRPSTGRVLSQAIRIPAKIAFQCSPSSAILILILIFNGLVNMILSSLGSVYQTRYGFPATTAGLTYLGIGIGGLIALAVAKRSSLIMPRKLGDRKDDQSRSFALFIAVALPLGSVGLLCYGWALQGSTHFMIPILGLSLFGFTYMAVRLTAQLFLIESVPEYSGSVMAAYTVASSIGGAIIPLATFPLNDKLGYGLANTIISMLNLGLTVIPLGIYVVSKYSSTE